MMQSTTSFADPPSIASPSCCQSLRPRQTSTLLLFESDIPIKRLFNGECAPMSGCCDKSSGTLRCSSAQSLKTAKPLINAQRSPSTMPSNRRSSSKYFNCNLCSFVCTWAYDLSLHLRQKHGIHKKL